MIRVILVICASCCVLTIPAPSDKCKITEKSCVVKVVNRVYELFFIGDDSLDPAYYEMIEGHPGDFHFKFTDLVVRGFKNCTIPDASMDIDTVHFEVTLLCNRLAIEGKYSFDGKIFELPLEGSGTFAVESPKYEIHHHMTLELSGTDKETQIQIKNATFDAKPLGKVSFKFDNLFNGNKELTEAAYSYAHENWKALVLLVQDPFFEVQMAKTAEAANKYFKKTYLQRSFIL